ncbi:hypothetical protein ABC347_13645 [Sphingomonas sp. 1P06PA]|uniref:hypothetical protein n=1 Tax=Sphingomonas sp. 1P06PA TaxID=554121 RepID=UPI0039A44F92
MFRASAHGGEAAMFMDAFVPGHADVAGADLAPTVLTPLEWRVVMLARREADRFGAAAIGSGSAAGRWLGRAWARMTGQEGVRRLADDRLEALRQFVCLARRNDRRLCAAATGLAALGFAPAAIELARAAALG